MKRGINTYLPSRYLHFVDLWTSAPMMQRQYKLNTYLIAAEKRGSISFLYGIKKELSIQMIRDCCLLNLSRYCCISCMYCVYFSCNMMWFKKAAIFDEYIVYMIKAQSVSSFKGC